VCPVSTSRNSALGKEAASSRTAAQRAGDESKGRLSARHVSSLGGEVALEVAGDRIQLGGHAVTVAHLNSVA